ncbi:DNA ligase D [Devosia subaequoris]|uniref:DNA ligase (ATP) n=1 Tax=Devosia subaequoris TaxID=395930 RepID=A0A7W6NBF1_9HYPH|nr:DNA ligase D [Devosia subaequoris]MBB4051898.1 DNA ligase D [Devosia subaequoris]MCP1210065.1 DNA ligase D [Devosia subaequoris]
MVGTRLTSYRSKRNFERTTEPFGTDGEDGFRFVVHKHHATADHYDLRLELGGVLKSWAIPKGPSLNPADKRLAVATEDHPVDYIDFEGVIPVGEYGGGPMIVWDTGTWAPMGDPEADIAKGAFKFRLAGEKLSGGWMLTRLKNRPEDKGKSNWLLFKEHDQAMNTHSDVLETHPESVKTGRRIEQLLETSAPSARKRRRPSLRPEKLEGAVAAPLPDKTPIQLATAAAAPPSDSRTISWLHEIKFDGYRTLARLEGKAVRLVTRGGLDWTRRYGDLPEVFTTLPCKQTVLDGEIVVLDEQGVSNFGRLQEALSGSQPRNLLFFAFDLLYLDGWDLRGVAVRDRKALLKNLLIDAPPAIQFSDHVEGLGEALFAQAIDKGLEGIVSKRADSIYSGKRSSTWLKIKAPKTGDFVIAGYTASPSAGGIGAIAVAEWAENDLVYRGKVGTGFDATGMASLLARLQSLETDDRLDGAPKEVITVKPLLTARIQYAEITSEGLLRHAVFRGLREASLTARGLAPRKRLVTDADLAGIWVTNPTRRLFGRNGPTKLDIAVYYASVGDFMLPHLFGRPVSLFRCPTGKSADCFFQRHPFTGMPEGIAKVESANGEGEKQTFIAVTNTKGYLALAQFGAVEYHAWGTHLDHIDKPDRIIFDLDPGEGVAWRDVVNAAVHLRGELQALGLAPFVKTSGGKGVHIVVPTTPKLTWKAAHAASASIAAKLAATGPDTFVTVMGAANRKRRIFIDYHRNARSATAVAAYSLRARTHLPASTPIEWNDLESIDSPEDLNYSTLPRLLTMSGDPWADINTFSQDLPA